MARLTVKTHRKREVLDITDVVEATLRKSQLPSSCLCNLALLHTTAALTTADLDPGTDLDILDFLDAITPKLKYRHPHNPAHAPDHILSAVIGTSLTLPVQDSQFVLGTWQRVVLIELDGPRERELVVSVSPVL